MTNEIIEKITTAGLSQVAKNYSKKFFDTHFKSIDQKEVEFFHDTINDLVVKYTPEVVDNLLKKPNIVRASRKFILAILSYENQEKINIAKNIYKGVFNQVDENHFEFDKYINTLENLSISEIKLLGEAQKTSSKTFILNTNGYNHVSPFSTRVGKMMQYHPFQESRSPGINNGLFCYLHEHLEIVKHFEGLGIARKIPDAKNSETPKDDLIRWLTPPKDSTYYITEFGQDFMFFLNESK